MRLGSGGRCAVVIGPLAAGGPDALTPPWWLVPCRAVTAVPAFGVCLLAAAALFAAPTCRFQSSNPTASAPRTSTATGGATRAAAPDDDGADRQGPRAEVRLQHDRHAGTSAAHDEHRRAGRARRRLRAIEHRRRLGQDATLTDAQLAELQALAIAAFTACGCSGLARVDCFLDDSPGGVGCVVNEVNTMPGFTPISMFPRMWNESGIDYPTLIDTLIQDALRRGTGLR